MSLQSLYWSEPLWLLLVLQPIVLLLLRWLHNRQQLSRYADTALQPWVEVHRNKHWSHFLLNRNIIYFSAWLLIAVATAGPRFIEEISDNNNKHGVDIMVVVDISRSMHVQDVSPNRLVRAKLELQSLLPQLQQDRLGLVVYAAHAHQYMPLTYDKNVMRHYLGNIDTLSPPTQGSRPTEALRFADQLLKKQASDTNRHKAILLITDGEGLQSPEELDTPVFILGTGSVEGDAIPGHDGEWLQDNNRVLVSRLHEDILIELAAKNNGLYSRAYKDNIDWDILYQYGIKGIRDTSISQNSDEIIWRELYVYTLFPGLLLLIISTVSLNTRNRQKISLIKGANSISKTALIAFCLFLTLIHNPAEASDNSSAYNLFIEKDYIAAVEKYRAIDGYHGRFGEASSAYRLKDFGHAISSFKLAFLSAENDEQRASALYNLGNSYFQSGDYAAAIISYQDSLIYKADNRFAQKNMDFSQKLYQTVQKRLARLAKLQNPGRGPKQGQAADKTKINDDTSVSVDESNDVLQDNTENGINLTSPLAEKLILKGLEHAQLASSDNSATEASSRQQDKFRSAISHHQLDVIKDDQQLFWNRIFEVEEGFPAPLDKPNNVKGVDAW